MSQQRELDFTATAAGGAPSPAGPHFDGSDYDPALDHARLTGQILRVFGAMQDGAWRTLDEIAALTGDPHASISAQLRHLRKEKFGAHTVNKRRRGEPSAGLWEYQLIANPNSSTQEPTT